MKSIERKLQNLAAVPVPKKRVDDQGTLNLEGLLVGTSDVNAALLANPTATNFNAYSLHTLFIDENIIAPTKSVSLLSPSLKVIEGPKMINLSGRSGAEGADGITGIRAAGNPGEAGEHSGHFYAKSLAFGGFDQLTITTKGGNGGPGGHGAKGANGAPGRDGNLAKVTKTQDYHKVQWAPGQIDHVDDYGTRQFFQDQGTNGQHGQEGGQGGKGAPGGHPGLVLIDGIHWNHIPQNGQNGKNGSAGFGGEGGLHGKHCMGKIVTDIKTVIQGQPPVFIANLEEDRPHHLSRNPSQALKGNPGMGLNRVGSQPLAEQQSFNVKGILKGYRNFYHQGLADAETQLFVRLIPPITIKAYIAGYKGEIERQHNDAATEAKRSAVQEAEEDEVRALKELHAFKQAEREALEYGILVAREQDQARADQQAEDNRRDQETKETKRLDRERREAEEEAKKIAEAIALRPVVPVVAPAPPGAIVPSKPKRIRAPQNVHTKKKIKHHGINKPIHKVKKWF